MAPTPILVTGGAGYIGSQCCKALHGAGYLPVAFDDLSRGHRALVRWGPLETGDVGDRDALGRVFVQYRPAAVMHFAALSEVAESVREPEACYRNNTAATLTLLRTMQEHSICHLIFSSTCAVYGVPGEVPITEDTERRPVSPYGRSKLAAEWMLEDAAAAGDLRFVGLRYFNACGADPDGETGECHDPETHLIPRILKAALGELPEVAILGTDYPTPDGTCIRDYIHVRDIAEAHIAALDHSLGGGANAFLNIGTGSGFSVREIIAAAERIIGRSVPVREEARREGDPPVLYAEPARAREVLGFSPRNSDLETIIGTAWAWHESRAAAPLPA